MKIKTFDGFLTLNNIFLKFINENGYLIGRFGNVEMSSVIYNDNTQLHSNAGFFWKTNEELEHFKKIYFDSIFDMDIYSYVCTCNSFRFIEDYLISKNIFRPTICYFEHPDVYLKVMETLQNNNLNVCIVSNNIELMEKQSKNINRIHEDKYKLHSDKFKFVKSHNTIEGKEKPFSTWLETLDDLEKRCLESNCKYFYIGCGSYGMPLASRLRKKNKNVWFVGGFIQVLFGINGLRWEKRTEIQELTNFYWTFPSKDIIMNKVETGGDFQVGCYN